MISWILLYAASAYTTIFPTHLQYNLSITVTIFSFDKYNCQTKSMIAFADGLMWIDAKTSCSRQYSLFISANTNFLSRSIYFYNCCTIELLITVVRPFSPFLIPIHIYLRLMSRCKTNKSMSEFMNERANIINKNNTFIIYWFFLGLALLTWCLLDYFAA
jgi:hypothetical protein